MPRGHYQAGVPGTGVGADAGGWTNGRLRTAFPQIRQPRCHSKRSTAVGRPDAVNADADADEPQALPETEGSAAHKLQPLRHNGNTDSGTRWALLVNEDGDLYLLRGLLWCGVCDETFACCQMSTGIRYYGCTHVGCPRPLVNAEEVEQVAWRAFALRHEAEAVGIKRNERHTALHDALVRVTVHSGATELDLEWRD